MRKSVCTKEMIEMCQPEYDAAHPATVLYSVAVLRYLRACGTRPQSPASLGIALWVGTGGVAAHTAARRARRALDWCLAKHYIAFECPTYGKDIRKDDFLCAYAVTPKGIAALGTTY